MQEDPAFYRKFSEMLEDVIRAFREKRLADRQYLKQVMEIADKIRNRSGDDLPERLRTTTWPRRFTARSGKSSPPTPTESTCAPPKPDAAMKIDEIICRGEDRQLDDERRRSEPDEERNRGLPAPAEGAAGTSRCRSRRSTASSSGAWTSPA